MMFKRSNPSAVHNPHSYVEERLSAYMDGQLPNPERQRIRKHLEECPHCRESLETLSWTVRLLKQVPAPALPRQFTLPVPEAKRPAPLPGWLRWGLAGASAVAGVLVLLISLQLLSSGTLGSRGLVPAAAPAQPTQFVALAGKNTAPSAAPEVAPAVPPTTADSSPRVAVAQPTEPASNLGSAPNPAATVAGAPTAAAASLPPVEDTQAPGVGQSVSQGTPTQSCVFGCGGGAGGPPAPSIAPASGSGGRGPSADGTPGRLGIQSQREETVAATGYVQTTILNVRVGPTIYAYQLGTVYNGTLVQVIGRDLAGLWLEIIFPLGNQEGQTGWVYAGYVSVPMPTDELPVVEWPYSLTPAPARTPGPYIP